MLLAHNGARNQIPDDIRRVTPSPPNSSRFERSFRRTDFQVRQSTPLSSTISAVGILGGSPSRTRTPPANLTDLATAASRSASDIAAGFSRISTFSRFVFAGVVSTLCGIFPHLSDRALVDSKCVSDGAGRHAFDAGLGVLDANLEFLRRQLGQLLPLTRLGLGDANLLEVAGGSETGCGSLPVFSGRPPLALSIAASISPPLRSASKRSSVASSSIRVSLARLAYSCSAAARSTMSLTSSTRRASARAKRAG